MGFTVCELLASARSSGGLSFRSLPGVCLHRQTRGTPHPALPLRCLAKSTLGGRDGATLDGGESQTTESDTYEPHAVDKLLMDAAPKTGKAHRCPTAIGPTWHPQKYSESALMAPAGGRSASGRALIGSQVDVRLRGKTESTAARAHSAFGSMQYSTSARQQDCVRSRSGNRLMNCPAI